MVIGKCKVAQKESGRNSRRMLKGNPGRSLLIAFQMLLLQINVAKNKFRNLFISFFFLFVYIFLHGLFLAMLIN